MKRMFPCQRPASVMMSGQFNAETQRTRRNAEGSKETDRTQWDTKSLRYLLRLGRDASPYL